MARVKFLNEATCFFPFFLLERIIVDLLILYFRNVVLVDTYRQSCISKSQVALVGK